MKELVLPESVTTIENEAFAGNIGESGSDPHDANFVVRLNGNVETVGENLFGRFISSTSSYAKYGVIYAADKKIYDNFLQKTEGKTNKRMIVTYPVQLQYVYNGITLASETYAYNYELPESIALSALSAEWYADEACAQVLTAQTVLSALSANSENANLIDGNGVITLYAKDVEGENFVGKPGLVYDGNSYSGVGVNALLTDDSMEIDDTMTVTVVSYTDALGNVAAVAPAEICNAGTYVVAVNGQELEITIARRALDISALDWKVCSIDTDTSGESFVSSRLYLYIDAQNAGKTYASLDLLDMSVEEIRNRYSLYGTVSTANNSITRYRDGGRITVGLDASGFPADAFGVTYSGAFTATEYGMYDASATIAPSVNFTYYVTDTTGFNASGRSMAARAAALEAKAQAEEAKAERIRARSEALRKRAERMRGESVQEAEAAATAEEKE
ncbi:MAG: hypothetical protein HFE47_07300 [Clostridia bacterium]|nr:hypothetical protein [Clostridia bacterium]